MATTQLTASAPPRTAAGMPVAQLVALVVMVVVLVVAPQIPRIVPADLGRGTWLGWVITQILAWCYPVNLMQGMCFALFACAFNLLLGYVGLLSFGHAAYFGMASY